MLDSIFGVHHLRNEIIWQRGTASGGKAGGNKLVPNHDTIFHYVKSINNFTCNRQYIPYTDEYIRKRFVHLDEGGRKYRKQLSGRKQYLDESKGKPVSDIWTDIYPVNPNAKEKLGYATQKPVALLERIIKASSNKEDVVFDPFCGCATTMEAAHTLGRKWIGIDIAFHAIKRVATVRLRDRLKLVAGKDFDIEGVPRTLEGVKDLWGRDKYHFQKWAVEQVDGFVTTKRTADGGVDGRIYFDVPDEQELQSMAIEVKGGKNVNIRDLRALRGALDDDEALIAGLIIMDPLGTTKERNFRKAMADAGDLTLRTHMNPYAKMQMLTVQDILDGKRFHTPGVVGKGDRQSDLYTDFG